MKYDARSTGCVTPCRCSKTELGVSGRVSLGDRGWSVDELILLDELAGVLLNSPALPTTILVQPDWDAIESRIRTWMEHGRRRNVLRAEVLERFTEKILALDLDAVQQRFKEAEELWLPLSWWHRRSVWQKIESARRDGHASTTAELASAIERARSLRQEEQALTAAGDEARALVEGRSLTRSRVRSRSLRILRAFSTTVSALVSPGFPSIGTTVAAMKVSSPSAITTATAIVS